MKLLFLFILLLIAIEFQAQTNPGIGLVSIGFDDKTKLEFYESEMDNEPTEVLEFFLDSTISSLSIRNLNTQHKWLNPEVLWLDYHEFTFRCVSKTEDCFEIIVDNETGKSMWLKKSELTLFSTWETYLMRMFGIERLKSNPQKIRIGPSENSAEIKYEGTDCFIVKRMKDDWIEIMTPDYCDEDYTDSNTPLKSGWIKWRNGNELLINYFTTS
ncbi:MULTISPECIES: hypothetical protein [Maribacter]|uniref:Uncharacterized protein n=1 Tax=Maribacter flavus TaxID=1658664 RepID=A0ABU7IN26_9FLAO|nr:MULTISPECIES: hypothetical protein [Maribacter]MDC6407069.1 hypothetical protein [Maribacter sp. PR66]MEE1974216.1 hypothetical protein [Maribacter flavus]